MKKLMLLSLLLVGTVAIGWAQPTLTIINNAQCDIEVTMHYSAPVCMLTGSVTYTVASASSVVATTPGGFEFTDATSVYANVGPPLCTFSNSLSFTVASPGVCYCQGSLGVASPGTWFTSCDPCGPDVTVDYDDCAGILTYSN